MAKDLPEGLITQIDAGKRRPVLLFELGLSSTIRFAASRANILFPDPAGNTYTAKAIELGEIKHGLEGHVERITLKFDNVAKDMAAYANYEDFEGKSLVIKRIFLDDCDSSDDYNELFHGVMERPDSINQNWLTVSAKGGKGLNQKTHSRYYQKLCPWAFGGSECNRDGYARLSSLTASGTADSGGTTYLVDDALNQAADYWNGGNIKITYDGEVYHRIVTDFDADNDKVIWEVALPFSVDNTCTYVVYKGCDKTWSTCGANNAWGPSQDNTPNFGGFLHIADVIVTEDGWRQGSRGARQGWHPQPSHTPGQPGGGRGGSGTPEGRR